MSSIVGNSEENQQEESQQEESGPSSSMPVATTPRRTRSTVPPDGLPMISPGTAARSSISQRSRMDYALVSSRGYIVACVVETKVGFHINSLGQVC